MIAHAFDVFPNFALAEKYFDRHCQTTANFCSHHVFPGIGRQFWSSSLLYLTYCFKGRWLSHKLFLLCYYCFLVENKSSATCKWLALKFFESNSRRIYLGFTLHKRWTLFGNALCEPSTADKPSSTHHACLRSPEELENWEKSFSIKNSTLIERLDQNAFSLFSYTDIANLHTLQLKTL